jgi:hypothetical protein
VYAPPGEGAKEVFTQDAIAACSTAEGHFFVPAQGPDHAVMGDIQIRTLHDPEGAKPFLTDYWLAWANGVQGDGATESDAIANAKARLATGAEPDLTRQPN